MIKFAQTKIIGIASTDYALAQALYLSIINLLID